MIFASREKNKNILKKYTELWDKIKNEIEAIHGGKPIKYKKNFMWTKLKSNDDLPVGKMGIPSVMVVVGSVLQKDNKYYPQVYLHECLHEFVNEFLYNIHSIYLLF